MDRQRAEVQTLTVDENEAGLRLDRWLRRRWPDLAQGHIQKLARSGQLRVDGGRVRADARLWAGARVRVPPLQRGAPPRMDPPALSDRDAAFVRGLVLLSDDHVLVLNKPAGLAVQGGSKTTFHLDRLLGAFGDGEHRPRLVHRLDRETSGVLILGRSAIAAARLAAAFADRRVEKTYWALVHGVPTPPSGEVLQTLAKTGRADRERVAAVEAEATGALTAATLYATVARAAPRAAWLALRPLTGRTHQLRAHMLILGHPVLGDRKYRTASSRAASAALGLQLHARRLRIPHPSGGVVDVTAPASAELLAGFARFGFDERAASADPFERRR